MYSLFATANIRKDNHAFVALGRDMERFDAVVRSFEHILYHHVMRSLWTIPMPSFSGQVDFLSHPEIFPHFLATCYLISR